MPTSAEYRRSAEECRQHAAHATDIVERDTLLRMASGWDRLAEHKAKLEAREGGLTSAGGLCVAIGIALAQISSVDFSRWQLSIWVA